MNGTPGHVQTANPLTTLRRGIPLILAITVIVTAIAIAASLRETALYRSTAQVFIATNAIDTAFGDLPLLSTDPVRVLATQADVARVPEVAELSVEHASTDVSPDELLSESSVTASSGADSLNFTVTDEDPDAAQELADAYAAGYVQYRRELDTESLRRARTELEQQITTLQEDAPAAPTGTTTGETTTGEATTTTVPTATASVADRAIADLLDQSQDLRTKELLQASNSTLGRPADVAEKIQPHPVRSGVLGGVIGLILGVALVFVRDALNTRVRSAEEVESRLGIPLLGRIAPPPKNFADADRLASLEESHSLQAEAFRMLATSIELVNLERGAKSIAIASALEGEGKSTTAASLGVAFARRGYDVVVLEADVRHPSLHRMFNLQEQVGLSDVVLGRAELEDALAQVELQTEDEEGSSSNGDSAGAAVMPRGKLEVLLSGPAPPSPSEFLKSRRVAEIVSALTERADLVLIDTPPLLHLSDVPTMMLSAQIDSVVAAVRLGAARRHGVDELKRILDNAPVVKLGFFTTNDREMRGYGYGYGYRYSARRRGVEAAVSRQALTPEGDR